MRHAIAAALLSLPVLSACGGAGETGEPEITATDAFIMEPVSEGMSMGGIEVTVEGLAATLVSAASPDIETIELHTMTMEDGRMRMRPAPEGFEIAPGETLTLERGGNHFMMFGMSPELTAGDTATLTLTFTFEDGSSRTVNAEAEIRALGE